MGWVAYKDYNGNITFDYQPGRCTMEKSETEHGVRHDAQGFLLRSCPLCHEITNHKISCPRVNVDDPVHHPSHYNTGKIEVADFIDDQDLGRWESRIVSYVCRARYKGRELEDLQKARWYLDRKIAQLEKEKA